MRLRTLVLVGMLLAVLGTKARAAWILEVDTDGLDNGVLTYNTNFSFGGDTTTASQSAASPAVGMTGGDSIFGGNGANLPDTYVYQYTPAVDGDNLGLTLGTALNDNGHFASGIPAGGSAMYNVYATWPRSTNVTGGATRYELTDGGGSLFSVDIDQNTIQDNSIGVLVPPLGGGGEWVYLGTAALDANTTYTLTQSVTVTNSFVSMRAAGVLFDRAVPEPASLLLFVLGCALVGIGRCRAA